MREVLLTVGAILSLLTLAKYILTIFHGTTRPHRGSWFVFTLINTLVFINLASSGATGVIVNSFFAMVTSVVIFICSLKKGYGTLTPFDIGCIAFALFGIVLWQLLDNPLLSLFVNIIANFAGTVPTLVKTYHHADSEPPIPYLMSILSILLSIFAETNLNLRTLIFPVYVCVVNIGTVGLILRHRIRFDNHLFVRHNT